MYEKLKHIVKSIVPESVLKSQDRRIRYIQGLFYRGSKYQCNICDTKLRKFISLHTGDLMCPNCGSLPRARGLWNRVKDQLDHKVVLHFSPSLSIKEAVSNKTNTTKYLTTDYEGEFDTEFHFDIENIDLEDKSIDVIICYHVLEHIINDGKAISELYRILKPGGSCYIQTPFKEGDIYEDFNITDPKERIIQFGQNDHVRIYSPEGLKQRITQAGFNAEIITMKNDPKNYNGYKKVDITIMCHK